MNPGELLRAHRYAEAAAASVEQLRLTPDDPVALDEHATAVLCLGRLSEAVEGFRRVDAQQRARLEGSPGQTLKIGAIEWLLGNHAAAIETFRAAVDGIEDGSITYADLAGGVSEGLLLWYAGVSAPDDAAKGRALEYLRGRAGSRRIKYWPGPIALHVLGVASKDDVLTQACGTRTPEAAQRVARKDLLKRRQLVNAMFYFAALSRDLGSERDCAEQMRECARIENPILENEWYLARGEAERANTRGRDPARE